LNGDEDDDDDDDDEKDDFIASPSNLTIEKSPRNLVLGAVDFVYFFVYPLGLRCFIPSATKLCMYLYVRM